MTYKTNAQPVAAWYGKLLLLPVVLLLHRPNRLEAQRPAYFTANERKVDINTFNRAMETMLGEVEVPGMSLAVIENNKIVFSNTYGYKQLSQRTKAGNKTVFEACSLSKSFLVFVAHQLAGEGKLELDRPICQYLEYEPLQHDPRYRLITPRMILSHSSGLENWRYLNNSDTLEILSNPGETYLYSGEGYNYLAEAIGRILGQSYEAYITERIIKPFGLTNTYLKYREKKLGPFRSETPSDYATGHDFFGKELEKWKNDYPVPASSNQVTARDYAKLIVSLFDGNNISARGIRELLKPALPEKDGVYSGAGFMVITTGNDTIISQYGSNYGFKADFFYSTVNRRGFVFFSNSDRGRMMTAKLCEMTAGLDLKDYFEKNYPEHYPSAAVTLLRAYRQQDLPGMIREMDALRAAGKMGVNTLNVLGEEFMAHDAGIAKRLLEENVKWYPRSATAYHLLGSLYAGADEYEAALQHFTKAGELNYDARETEKNIEKCEAKIKEAAWRSALVARLQAQEASVLQAEDYNAMKGIRLETSSDGDGGRHVGFIDTNDWMDYQVSVAAPVIYSVSLRVASQDGGSQLQFRSGAGVLATVDVPATHGWSKWTTLTTSIALPAGSQTLRLYATAGGFNLNWMQFTPANGGKP